MLRIPCRTALAALSIGAVSAMAGEPPAAGPAQPAAPQRISVALTVPDLGWNLAIDEVYIVGGELWVIASVSRPPDLMAGQALKKARDTVTVEAPALPRKYFILGKTWDWDSEEPYKFLPDKSAIADQLAKGKRIWQRAAPPPPAEK
jgi:hypothetical protein